MQLKDDVVSFHWNVFKQDRNIWHERLDVKTEFGFK